MAITLSREQFKQKYGQEGLDLFNKPEPQDHDPSFLQRAGTALKERGQEFKKTFQERGRGDITALEATVRTFGDVAGGVGDVVGAAISPQVEKLAKVETLKPAFEALGQGMEKYEVWKGSSETNRRVAEVLEATVNIADLVGGLKGGGKLLKVGKEAVETGVEAGIKGAKDVVESTLDKASKLELKGIAGDVIPSADRVISHEVSKALELTKGDIATISKSTGNDVGEWVASKNLIGKTKEATQDAIESLKKKSFKEVRDTIDQIETTFKQGSVPRYSDALKVIKKQIKDVPGLEEDLKTVNNLLRKGKVTLSDVQKTKELLDEHFSLFKATGDVSEGTAKKGLVELRKEIREFIESTVDNELGVDIRALNNDVATAKSISDAIIKRSPRGLTKSSLSIADLGLFGSSTAFGNPLLGVGLVIGRKILGSPAVRLRFAKWVESLSNAKKLRVKNAIEAGRLPDDMPNSLKKSINELPDPKK